MYNILKALTASDASLSLSERERTTSAGHNQRERAHLQLVTIRREMTSSAGHLNRERTSWAGHHQIQKQTSTAKVAQIEERIDESTVNTYR